MIPKTLQAFAEAVGRIVRQFLRCFPPPPCQNLVSFVGDHSRALRTSTLVHDHQRDQPKAEIISVTSPRRTSTPAYRYTIRQSSNGFPTRVTGTALIRPRVAEIRVWKRHCGHRRCSRCFASRATAPSRCRFRSRRISVPPSRYAAIAHTGVFGTVPYALRRLRNFGWLISPRMVDALGTVPVRGTGARTPGSGHEHDTVPLHLGSAPPAGTGLG